MQTEIGVVDRAEARLADERWTAWVAKGVDHDRKTKKRAVAAVAVVASGLALWLATVLLLG